MDTDILTKTAQKIATRGKGILAADESTSTATKRFEALGIESTEENRREYRNLLLTTPEIEQYISGVILYEETLMQKTDDGVLFPEYLSRLGVEPGIKVDKGLVDYQRKEQVTQGLDTLAERIEEYKRYNPTFAKWRAVYTISDSTPSDELIDRNASDLAQYAKICQEHGIVPIVEPEVLMDGNHTIERSHNVTRRVLEKVFQALEEEGVYLPGTLLKPSMVIAGKDSSEKASPEEIAQQTLDVLIATVPGEIGGVFFLSGGQTPEEATRHLELMHELNPNLPWYLSFSYGRALQDPAIKAWAANREDKNSAQQAFLKRAHLNSLATKGEYATSLESK